MKVTFIFQDSRKEKQGLGKTTNVLLSERGINALRKVDIEDLVLEETTPLQGRYIHNIDGKTETRKYGIYGEVKLINLSRFINNNYLEDYQIN